MDAPPQPASTRPQYLRTHRQVLDATEQLLAEVGPSRVTIEQIAQRSSASTATIYRHWPSKTAIIAEAFGHRVARSLPTPDTGDPLADLVEMSMSSLGFHTHEGGGVFFELLAICSLEPEGRTYFQQFYLGPRRRAMLPLFERAAACGLLQPGVDADLAMDVLFGAAVFRALRLADPPTAGQLRAIINLALTGLLSEKGARAHDDAR